MSLNPFQHESARVAALRELEILDTAPEPLFDHLTELAALTFDMPISLISLVDSNRQWFKARYGTDSTETPRDIAFCNHVIQSEDVMVVSDAHEDPRFKNNPLVTDAPHVRFYAGAPLITPEGFELGALCVIDHKPRPDFTKENAEKLRAFAQSVTHALLLRARTRDHSRLAAVAKERLELLTIAGELAGIGAWSWSTDTRAFIWSNQVYQIFGTTPGSKPPKFRNIIRMIAPADRAGTHETVREALTAGKAYSFEAWINLPGGERKLIGVQGIARRTPAGQIIGMHGAVQDMTQLRLADEVIRQNAERTRLLSKLSSDLIIRHDASGAMTSVSDSIRVYGYEPDAITERDLLSLVHPEDVERAQVQRDQNLAGHEPAPAHQREYRLRRADGTYAWMQGNPTVIKDSSGNVVETINIFRDISDRKEMEARVEASELHYRLLAENSQDLIACFTPDGVLTYISPSIEGVLGYSPEEATGQPVSNFVHPEDIKRTDKAIMAYVAQGPDAPSPRYEYRARHKDGHYVWVEARPRAIYDAAGKLIEFQDVVRDIAQRKAVEDALAANEARFRLMAENASDVICCYDLDTIFSYVSPSIENLLGYTAAELVGGSAASQIHPDDLPMITEVVGAYLAGPPGTPSPRYAYRAFHKDGHIVWLESHPRAVHNAAGEVIEIQDLLRDITTQKMLEAELQDARDAAVEAADAKARFLANMSHEIRTPLTAIIGYSDLLSRREDLANEAATQVQRVSKAAKALISIVNDVLDYSKIEAGQMSFSPRTVSPREILGDVLGLFAPIAEKKGLALAVIASPDTPEFVRMDGDRIRQVLMNLVGNAVKFTERGSVRLVSSYDKATARLTVRVEDTGEGLSEEQQARLFQRFSQVDSSSTRRHGGTGLGLAICKGIVEAMGGEIGVTSLIGEGSSFYLTVGAPEMSMPTDLATSQEDAEALDGLRVLVVDDNDSNRDIARAIVERFGGEAYVAEDGLGAVEQAQTLPFDIILMDRRMPNMTGDAAMAVIRSTPGPNQRTPILMFSADGSFETTAKGYDGVVQKPIVPHSFIHTLREFDQVSAPAPAAVAS